LGSSYSRSSPLAVLQLPSASPPTHLLFLYPQIPIEFKLDTCKFQLSADSAPHQATLYINRCLQPGQAHFQIYYKRMPSFVDCEKIFVLKIFNFVFAAQYSFTLDSHIPFVYLGIVVHTFRRGREKLFTYRED
jgi:hypothetical protein